MATASIPVEVFNPGQVFACMGFLEAAEALRGPAEGGFDWTGEPRFTLHIGGAENPIEVVLAFLADAVAEPIDPGNASQPGSDTFPAQKPDAMSLPITLRNGHHCLVLSHWADGCRTRETFKLYAGNRSALDIARKMLGRDTKDSASGIHALWTHQRSALLADPLGICTPMIGRFSFDPRGNWTALGAGYSLKDLPKQLKQQVMASPVVELLAPLGLEHARPAEIALRSYRYAIWNERLPPQLARAALSGHLTTHTQRHFHFLVDDSGKNKVVCYSTEETTP